MHKKNTKAIHTRTKPSQNREHSTPIFMTSGFSFDDAEHGRALFADEVEGNIYSRYSNPNTSEFVDKMVQLENAEAGFAFATGMAAIFSSFGALLSSGDHVLASRSLFGSTHQILERIFSRWGIEHTFVDADKPETWEAAICPNTKILFAETPSNPGLDIIDLEWLGKLKEKHSLILSIDNTFATPLIQTPTDFGADLIIHSATKMIDGQGRALGGIIVGKEKLMEDVRYFLRQTGPSLSPFNAWLFSKSLETLAIRVERHSSSALKLANFLADNQNAEKVKYPFLKSHPQYELARKQMRSGGGVVTFVVKGGFKNAKKFIDSVRLASISANLGDTRTIITHPYSTTHSKLSEDARQRVGIEPGLIRVSVGLEEIDDIQSDIAQALKAATK